MAVAEGVEVARTGATVGEKVECVQRFLTGLRDHRIFTNLSGKVNGKFVILLNVNNVLSMQEIGEMGQAAASATDVTTVDA
jgi:hypothetical protein